MAQDKSKINRLARLERVRMVARQEAATAAAHAENHFTRLSNLAARSAALVDEFSKRNRAGDASALRHLRDYHAALEELNHKAQKDSIAARSAADARQSEFAQADRSRDLAQERFAAALKARAKERNSR